MTDQDGLQAAEAKMREAGQPDEAIRSFRSAYERLVNGESAMLPSAELEPEGDVEALEDLPEADAEDVLDRVAVIKLNGGLATSMGLRSPKSLLEVHDGRSFLEIIVGQTLALRKRHGVRLPLVLMDSEATREETLRALEQYRELGLSAAPDGGALLDHGLSVDFLQSMVPKLDAEKLEPVTWEKEPSLEWNPPGHGDVYPALRGSGMLDSLLERGIRYAMISNADNLGSTTEPRIAAHMEQNEIPFLMEVVLGTEADRKGGHIARRKADGRLVLRETAQTPDEDQESFRDYRRWRYYNTNSLWVDLRVLAAKLDDTGGVLELPLIVNRKTVDPRDKSSPAVIQLESAMGAAIGSFEGAQLLRVPRTRFAPVKTTDDLLVLRSDVYTLNEEDMVVAPVKERAESLPYVELDPDFYKLLDDFEQRFPDGPPSLREAERLIVHGDVTFGGGVRVRGSVELEAPEPMQIDAGATLESD